MMGVTPQNENTCRSLHFHHVRHLFMGVPTETETVSSFLFLGCTVGCQVWVQPYRPVIKGVMQRWKSCFRWKMPFSTRLWPKDSIYLCVFTRNNMVLYGVHEQWLGQRVSDGKINGAGFVVAEDSSQGHDKSTCRGRSEAGATPEVWELLCGLTVTSWNVMCTQSGLPEYFKLLSQQKKNNTTRKKSSTPFYFVCSFQPRISHLTSVFSASKFKPCPFLKSHFL